MTNTSIGDCVRCAPSPQAGIILFVALQEHTTNPVKYAGHTWAAMSHEEWLVLTGLSENQLKHALRRMRDAKLIKRKFRRNPAALLIRPLLEVEISTFMQTIAQPASQPVQAVA